MDYLKRFALWFISGAGLVLGISAMALAIELAKPYLFPQDSESIANPRDLTVSKIDPVSVTTSAAVTAVVTNTSATTKYGPSVYELRFLQGERQLFVCEPYKETKTLAPGASAPIQLVCPEVERAALPRDVTYALRVRSAWRFH